MSRSEFKYLPRKKDDDRRVREILAIKADPNLTRYGVLRVTAELRRRGYEVNKKYVYRIMRTLNLLVRKRRRQKRLAIAPTKKYTCPSKVNQIWAMDFVTSHLLNGTAFRCFTVVDIYSRQSPVVEISTSMAGFLTIRALEKLRLNDQRPEAIILDNGPEFNNHTMLNWSKKHDVSLHFIDPGKPVQNAYIESFNGRLRDECLNVRTFKNLGHARSEIEQWLRHYNETRPHSSLDYKTPKEFATEHEEVVLNKNITHPSRVVLKTG
jgi:putative transposase